MGPFTFPTLAPLPARTAIDDQLLTLRPLSILEVTSATTCRPPLFVSTPVQDVSWHADPDLQPDGCEKTSRTMQGADGGYQKNPERCEHGEAVDYGRIPDEL